MTHRVYSAGVSRRKINGGSEHFPYGRTRFGLIERDYDGGQPCRGSVCGFQQDLLLDVINEDLSEDTCMR